MARQRMYSENVGGNWGLPAGYMEAATAPGRSYASAISSVGSSIAGAITKYQEDKQAGEIRRAEFEANSEILGREFNDKEGGVTEADVKMIEGLAKYEGASKGAQMAMNESVKVALKKSEREREIQRQVQQQNFVNSAVMRNENFQQQVEARVSQGQQFGQQFQTRQQADSEETNNLNRAISLFNLGQSQVNANNLALDRQATQSFVNQQNGGISLGGIPQGYLVTPEDINRYNNPPLRPGTVQQLPGLPGHVAVTTGKDGGMNLIPTPRPDYKPEIITDPKTGIIYYRTKDGDIKQLNVPKPENSSASFAALSIQKMIGTIEELEKMKLNGETKARVDDSGVVHKSSWYRVDEDIDALIQGFKQKMIEARRLTGRRDDNAGGADYTVDKEGKIVPIK